MSRYFIVFAAAAAAWLGCSSTSGDTPAVEAAPPSGSYAKSCPACTATPTLLTCFCGDGDGAEDKTTLPLPCSGDIANCGGTLTCGGCGGPSGGCKNDSDCESACSSDCYQCLSGSCTCGYEGVSGCVF